VHSGVRPLLAATCAWLPASARRCRHPCTAVQHSLHTVPVWRTGCAQRAGLHSPHVTASHRSHTSPARYVLLLQAVVQETLRLHPPAPITSRCASQDITLCGILFPAGTPVHIDIMALHMDPRYWQEPARFRPKRFLKVWAAGGGAGAGAWCRAVPVVLWS
jgi:cytochrome P450